MKNMLRISALPRSHPTRILMVYFMGTDRTLLTEQDWRGPKAERTHKFYKPAISMYKKVAALGLEKSPQEYRNTVIAEKVDNPEQFLDSHNRGAEVRQYPWRALSSAQLPSDEQDTAWKFGWGVLPTRDRLSKWKVTKGNRCTNCKRPETNKHAILECPVARTFWYLVDRAYRDFKIRRFVHYGRCPSSALARLLITVGIFVLWKNRCAAEKGKKPHRNQWHLLVRLYSTVMEHLETELFFLGEREFLKKWSCPFIETQGNRVFLRCTAIELM